MQSTASQTSFGLHYFPDFVHYRQADLKAWLPEIHALKATWLTLLATPERAIPEYFITELLQAKIQPILHLPLSLSNPPSHQDLEPVFSNYSRWGVRYVALFDRPNTRQAWASFSWARANLVDRFLDLFIPIAELAIKSGLLPLFPPLEPGGDYWDTAFLQAALQGIQKRGRQVILDQLGLGAYAWASNRPLNWGAGGPERWPEARPYSVNPQIQDQRGFRIFDWYLAIGQTVLGKKPPIFLLRAGSRLGDNTHPGISEVNQASHTRINLTLAQLALAGANSPTPEGIELLPPQVQACNLWLLSTSAFSPFRQHAWFQPDGSHLPIVDAIQNWQKSISESQNKQVKNELPDSHPIAHYLLLPSFEWGAADWYLDIVRPYQKKYCPTVGFSISEAKKARRVTLVGEYGAFPEDYVDQLLMAGCIVEQIRGSGMELASLLSNQ